MGGKLLSLFEIVLTVSAFFEEMHCLHVTSYCAFVLEFCVTDRAGIFLSPMSLLVITQATLREEAMLAEITSKWKHSVFLVALIHMSLIEVGAVQVYVANWAFIGVTVGCYSST